MTSLIGARSVDAHMQALNKYLISGRNNVLINKSGIRIIDFKPFLQQISMQKHSVVLGEKQYVK